MALGKLDCFRNNTASYFLIHNTIKLFFQSFDFKKKKLKKINEKSPKFGVSEATALPIMPQPVPYINNLIHV